MDNRTVLSNPSSPVLESKSQFATAPPSLPMGISTTSMLVTQSSPTLTSTKSETGTSSSSSSTTTTTTVASINNMVMTHSPTFSSSPATTTTTTLSTISAITTTGSPTVTSQPSSMKIPGIVPSLIHNGIGSSLLYSPGTPEKRGRGRPRKNPPPPPRDPSVPKRKRGRPPKLDKDGNRLQRLASSANPNGKKRGRPKRPDQSESSPEVKEETTAVALVPSSTTATSSSSSSSNDEDQNKKRSRPSKSVKTEDGQSPHHTASPAHRLPSVSTGGRDHPESSEFQPSFSIFH
ncbi:hypothetical protein SAMD00019534_090840, partial [Acytostelium subglobosum LB1]|uniref:hypothetical protein n=1 Tax=Acytostelium subglobosum LB1 TaxID=1410327 RepID=UPI000644896D